MHRVISFALVVVQWSFFYLPLSTAKATSLSPLSITLEQDSLLGNVPNQKGAIKIKVTLSSLVEQLAQSGNYQQATAKWILKQDNIFTNASNRSDRVIHHFISNDRMVGADQYQLPQGFALKSWQNAVQILVERFDGDKNFGCAPDLMALGSCYFNGDNLAPSKELQAIIKDHPIEYYQIEDNWLFQIAPLKASESCRQLGQSVACGNILIEHFYAMSDLIKKTNKKAKLISPRFHEVETAAFFDGGMVNMTEASWGSDCSPRIQKHRYNVEGKLFSQRFKTLFRAVSSQVSAMDIAIETNTPENIHDSNKWLRRVMGLKQKTLWSSHIDVPKSFYKFQSPPPSLQQACAAHRAHRQLSPFYDPYLYSELMTRAWIVAMSEGVEFLFQPIEVLPDQLRASSRSLSSHREIKDSRFLPVHQSWQRLQSLFENYKSITRHESGVYELDREDTGERIYFLWKEGPFNLAKLARIKGKLGDRIVRATELADKTQSLELRGTKFSFAELYSYLKSHPQRPVAIHR